MDALRRRIEELEKVELRAEPRVSLLMGVVAAKPRVQGRAC